MKRPETKGFSSSSNMFFAELSYKKHVPWIPVPKKPKKELSSNTSISSFRKKNHPFRGWLLGPYPSIGWWFWMLWSSGGVKDEAKLLFWFFPAEIKPYKNTKRNDLDFAKVPRFLSAFFFQCFFSCFAYVNVWNLTTTWCCGWYLCFQCLGLEADTLVLETCDAARWSISALWTWPWRYFKVS